MLYILPKDIEYEKKRLTYKRDECTACLDDVKNLGKFVEVEGSEDKIRQVLQQLGITQTTKESYPDLIRNLLH